MLVRVVAWATARLVMRHPTYGCARISWFGVKPVLGRSMTPRSVCLSLIFGRKTFSVQNLFVKNHFESKIYKSWRCNICWVR